MPWWNRWDWALGGAFVIYTVWALHKQLSAIVTLLAEIRDALRERQR